MEDEVMEIMNLLKEAQNNLLAALFEIDGNSNLKKAVNLIADTMDGISDEYGLPKMSERESD